MEFSSLIPIPTDPSVAYYIIIPIVTSYVGIYVMLSNYYILKPKIQPFLEKLFISSTIVTQLLLDLLSNLSFITYAVSSFFLASHSDRPYRLLQTYNLYWLSFYLAFVMFGKFELPLQVNKLVVGKNGFILLLFLVNIAYHYLSQTFLVSLPSIFLGLYLLNIFLNANQQKFIKVLLQFVGLKEPIQAKQIIQHKSCLPSIEQLSENYPITRLQLNQCVNNSQKIEIKQLSKIAKGRKESNNKIDTKRIVRDKLIKICLCIHLSLKKKHEEDVDNMRKYYESFNGSRKQTKKNFQGEDRQKKSYFSNVRKDKQNILQKSCKKFKLQEKRQQFLESGNSIVKKIQTDSIYTESLLFWIFPIRVFQFSPVISVIFNIFINLAFGLLLNYCQNAINTLLYGRFVQFLLAFLLLPMVPQIHPLEYMNTMALSSILKYGICGLFCLFSSIQYMSNNNTASIEMYKTRFFGYQQIVILILVIISFTTILSKNSSWKMIVVFGLASLGINLWLTYLSITNPA